MVPQPPASLKSGRVPLLKGDKNLTANQPALVISPPYEEGDKMGGRSEPRTLVVSKSRFNYLK
jgi:hypothetical protein